MGARQKLNQGYFAGSLLLAAFIGGVTQSFLAFLLTLVVLLVLSLQSGDIRPSQRGRWR